MVIQFGQTARWIQLIFIFGCTFIIPLASSFYLLATRVISSIKMEKREDRIFPFAMASMIYIATCITFYVKFGDPFFVFISMGLSIVGLSVVLATIITFFWKISIHSIGIGGLTGLIISMNFFQLHRFQLWAVLTVIIVSGFVMSARLYLSSHRPVEVYVGYAIGCVVTFIGGTLFLWR